MSIRPVGDGAAPIVEAEVEIDPAVADLQDQELVSDIHFEHAYDSVKDKPLAVRVVVLRGLERTRHDVISRELLHLTSANSLEEIKDALLEAHDTLKSLQIFDVVDCIIDEGPLEVFALRNKAALSNLPGRGHSDRFVWMSWGFAVRLSSHARAPEALILLLQQQDLYHLQRLAVLLSCDVSFVVGKSPKRQLSSTVCAEWSGNLHSHCDLC